ncbi:dTDP-4-dehydrorhamnose 3,5-epimerase family protein [Spirosoma rigui]|uniref:dTDP-4-dehydrorhamnose 3,5-epimerase family protein n=1 Tax=Spirosoma rigui TaxID=564064 RepID=UPI0009AF774C|nr:dTDP-4-dehydrorhamnose 3,5-epimerase family protein [Spirosoma rigui]
MQIPPVSHTSQLIAGITLHGVDLKVMNEERDQRGSFTETFATHWRAAIEPTQWSMVRSAAHVLRGLHIHQRHDEYFCLIDGHCLVGLYDVRPDSPTYQQHSLYELFGTDLKAVIFPTGLLHGWYFYEPSMHLQAVSESYKDYAHDDNFGCRWDDPELGIPWGIINPILSERATSFPPLADLLVTATSAGAYF